MRLLLAGWMVITPCVVMAVPTTVTLTPVADTTLFSEDGTLASGADDGTFVGLTRANASRRTLVRFDLSSIPANATVSGATLSMSVTRALNSPLDVDVRVHRVLASWGEGTSTAGVGGGAGGPATADSATWTHRSWPNTLWSSAGGDFEPIASATRAIGAINTYAWPSTPAIVADVQGWVQNAAANQGWLLIAADLGTSVTAKRLGSREFAIAAQRPTLQVTYEVLASPTTQQVPIPGWMLAVLATALVTVAGALGHRRSKA